MPPGSHPPTPWPLGRQTLEEAVAGVRYVATHLRALRRPAAPEAALARLQGGLQRREGNLLARLREVYENEWSGYLPLQRPRMPARGPSVSGWMSLRFFTATRTGEVMSRLLNDVNGVQEVVTRSIVNVMSNFVIVAAVVVVMVGINWKLAVVPLIVLPLFIVPVRSAGRIRARIARETQGKMAEVSGRMQESLGINGILLMKVFGRQALELARFRSTNRELMDLQVRQGLVGRWFRMFVGLFGTVSPAVIFWYGGWEVVNGNLTLGGVVAFTAYIARIYTPISQLINIQIDLLASVGLFERIFEYLDMQPDVVEKADALRPGPARGHVRFEGVWFAYGLPSPLAGEGEGQGGTSRTPSPVGGELEGAWALGDLTFEAASGQLVALVGPSGAGKTTITYLIPRLYDPTSGAVCIDGYDLRDVALDWIGESIALVPQETFLFHTTVRENIAYGNPGASEQRIVEAAQAANIHDFIVSLAQGYDTVVGERGFRLSGGERQRIAIARAVLKDPRIIILDEATSVQQPAVSGAKHIVSRFMAESLMDREVLRQTDTQPVLQLLPDTVVVKIGGQSILDRGRSALLPVVDELGENLRNHKLIISVGEGTRARHSYAIASDLGLPTGVLSIMGDVIANQNALIVTTIMMRYGAVRVPEDHFDMFPIFLNSGCPIVICGMAPYRWWEMPPEVGRVPEHRSDTGSYLTSEVFGCRAMIFIKDVDGLYTADPKTDPNAEFIPRISVGELLERQLPDLPIEPAVLDLMRHARHRREIQIINGLVRGTITRALAGEPVGTIISAD